MKKIVVILASLLLIGPTLLAQLETPPGVAALQNEKDSTVLNQKLMRLRNSNQEKDLNLLRQYYAFQRDNEKHKEITKLAAERFPRSEAAYSYAMQLMDEQKDAAGTEQVYKKLVESFPDRIHSMPQFMVASAYAAEKNSKKAIEYADKFRTDTGAVEMFYVILVEEMIKQNDFAAAEYLIIPALNAAKIGDSKQRYYSIMATYARLLLKKGKPAEAYPVIKEVYQNSSKQNATINNLFVSVLLASKKWDEALPVMEHSLTLGTASEETKAKIREVYVKVKGSEAGFDAFQANIREGFLKHIKEKVAKMIINQPSADFTLADVNGKQVSLAELKGKVVVLDFWATWCVPCKKSFPAMQMAVNRYKNDPNVKFLFIHTWERGTIDPAQDAKKYITANNYSFQVLVDRKNQQTGINKVVTDYKVSGIPAKFIIDGKGNIRFKLTGFSEGDEAALEEISAMIEMARNS
jgi:thiol-disulfide isomerase/thioredoxin